MAITWGGWKSVSGPVNFRAGIDITYSPATVTAGTTSVTVTTRIYLGAAGSAQASGASWSASGSDSGSGSGVGWDLNPGGGTALIATLTEVVALTYGSTKSFTINATVRPSGSWPGSVSHSRTITLPARPITAPSAPSGVAVDRVDDGRQMVTWSVPTSDARPVTKHRITRSVNGAAFQTVANLTGTPRAWMDSGTSAGNVYRYNVVAGNNAGETVGTPANVSVSTTPARPAAPTATKDSAGDIIVARPALSASATTWAVGEYNGATLATAIPASQATWKFESPSTAKTWRFVVLASSSTPALNSPWSAPSNTVQLLTAPAAPTNLLPNGTAHDATLPVSASWRHNALDETPQRKRQVRHRLRTTTTWTEEPVVTSPSATWTLPADTYENGQSVEWQVSTWGQATTGGRDGEGASPWSATATVPLSSPPVVDITSPAPGAVWTSSRVTIDWTYHDPEGSAQSSWKTALSTDGQQVDARAGSGSTTRRTSMNVVVEDGLTYTATLEARDGSGMWSGPAESTFTVQYALPPVPSGEATWYRDEGYVSMTVDVPDPGTGEVPAEQLSVYRANGDEWKLVQDGLAPGQTITDMTPQTGGIATYRVAATSDLPSSSWSTDIVVETPTRWLFLNYGPGLASVVRLWGSLSASGTASRQKVLHELAGLDYPIERLGRKRSRTYDLQATIFGPMAQRQKPDASSTWADLEDLADAPAPVLLRDPHGTRMFVSVGDVGIDNRLAVHPKVTIPLTQVSWHEDGVIL